MRAGRKSAEAKTALTLPSSTSSPAGRRSKCGLQANYWGDSFAAEDQASKSDGAEGWVNEGPATALAFIRLVMFSRVSAMSNRRGFFISSSTIRCTSVSGSSAAR